jgi:hypothetical protein
MIDDRTGRHGGKGVSSRWEYQGGWCTLDLSYTLADDELLVLLPLPTCVSKIIFSYEMPLKNARCIFRERMVNGYLRRGEMSCSSDRVPSVSMKSLDIFLDWEAVIEGRLAASFPEEAYHTVAVFRALLRDAVNSVFGKQKWTWTPTFMKEPQKAKKAVKDAMAGSCVCYVP